MTWECTRSSRSEQAQSEDPDRSPHPPLLHLPLQQLRRRLQQLGGRLQIAGGIRQRLLDLVLQLPVLDVAIEGAFADAEDAGGFFAVGAHARTAYAFPFFSARFNARSIFSIVRMVGEFLPCSIRLSVSARIPAWRANSACVRPSLRRARMTCCAITISNASKG